MLRLIGRWSEPLRPHLLPMSTIPGIVSEAKATPKWTYDNIDKLFELACSIPIERRTILFNDILHSIEVDYWMWGIDDIVCKRLVDIMATL